MAGSQEPFHAAIENSSDAIFLVNAQGQVQYASASTAKILGYQPEQLVGRSGLDLLHPADRDHSARALKKVVAEPQWPNRVRARVRQENGQWRWVESTAANLLDAPQAGSILVIQREIGKSRDEEEGRQRLVEELTRSNAELQAFAHTAAHDLREPLRTIAAFVQMLVRKAQLDEADREIANFIVDGVERMSALLEDLLSSATSTASDSLRPVELEQAAALAVQNLSEALTSSGATVTIEPLPVVQGNECELVRLFQNLIGNAVKYRSEAEVVVHISAERSGPDWVIRIRDNGIGIMKEQHRRIFGLFTRLHPGKIPGTGIGLAICKKIVEGRGGRIWVESELGAGSTFCFTVAAGQEESRRLVGAGVGVGST